MTSPSVLSPVGMALDTVRRVLFQPFNIVKWLVIGFTAWLAMMEGGLGSGLNFNTGNFGKGHSSEIGRTAWAWIQAHLLLIIPLLLFLFAVGMVFTLIVMWLSCRGKFMFLDNVVRNRAEIVDPWSRFRTQGNSCFLFLVCFVLASIAMLILSMGLAVLIGWPDLAHSQFGWRAGAAIVIGSIFFICFMITVLCVRAFLEDFVIPIMAVKSCRILEGWTVFIELLRRHAGVFILYLLFRAALSVAIGMITVFLCCLLCCTVMIPYVGTVILLPLHVFWRSYSIHFLEQFDDKIRLFDSGNAPYISLTHKQDHE